MNTLAVVLEEPERLVLSHLPLPEPNDEDVVVDVEWSGISTGTERLLWSGRMPPFPGLGYPLVPGYESVGRIRVAGSKSGAKIGERVFVPGARCYGAVRGLFGGASSRVIVPASKALRFDERLAEQGVLLALAATAYHALNSPDALLPDLIVGHGVLGRLLARLTIVLGGEAPIVWEANSKRTSGAEGYPVITPNDDTKKNYKSIYDVSGDSSLLDTLIARLSPKGEIVLAGFYSDNLTFAFPPAFMREARLRIAAEWKETDLIAVRDLIENRKLSLEGLITHCEPAREASAAYRTAFTDPDCLKMILDWRNCS